MQIINVVTLRQVAHFASELIYVNVLNYQHIYGSGPGPPLSSKLLFNAYYIKTNLISRDLWLSLYVTPPPPRPVQPLLLTSHFFKRSPLVGRDAVPIRYLKCHQQIH